jgi:hypothetical protein
MNISCIFLKNLSMINLANYWKINYDREPDKAFYLSLHYSINQSVRVLNVIKA